MKNLLLFLRQVLEESGTFCNIDTTLDYKYIERRVESEGLEFLTITLPSYAQDLERALEVGRTNLNAWTGFARYRREGIPQFLGGFMRQIFDPYTGVVLDDYHREGIDPAHAIKSVRQICYLFHKIRLECTEGRIQTAFDNYIKCEKEIGLADRILGKTPEVQARFSRISTLLFGDMFSEVDRKIFNHEIIPSHGPGATADKLVGNHKYEQREWPLRLESVFPFGEYVLPSWISPDSDEYADNAPIFLEPGAERPVKVISVPKTQKTPRIIAIEPTCMQYMQQGLKDALYEYVERDSFLYSVIGFTDQTPNQRMAREGSAEGGGLATLDLSEASDRVSCLHVDLLLANHSSLREAIYACRSSKADVPGHGIISLSKFASMGSALTFPLEAMIFLTLVFLAIEEKLTTPLTREAIEGYMGKVRVYGDDIIVPVEFVASVIESLESFGYRVNLNKSFWNGSFRESCGKEYFETKDVSIVRCRSMFPTSRKHTQEIVSLVSMRNQFFLAGMLTTCEYLDAVIRGFIPFPIVEVTSPALGRLAFESFVTQKLDPFCSAP